jgi:hypothetical protein
VYGVRVYACAGVRVCGCAGVCGSYLRRGHQLVEVAILD